MLETVDSDVPKPMIHTLLTINSLIDGSPMTDMIEHIISKAIEV